MALVAYDDSDIEDSDEDLEENHEMGEKETKNNHEMGEKETKNNQEKIPVISNETSLFSSLPLPKKDVRIENDDLFLRKRDYIPKDEIVKKPPKVKITIPLLTKSLDEKPATSLEISVHIKGKTKLLNMLPEPKFTIALPEKNETKVPKFIPRSVNSNKHKDAKPEQLHKASTKPVVNVEAYGSDESDTEDTLDSNKNASDFFSLNSEDVTPMNGIEFDNIDDQTVQADIAEAGSSHNKQQQMSYDLSNSVNNHIHNEGGKGSHTSEVKQGEVSPNVENVNHESVQLDEEAIIKLCGRKGRLRRENVQIIDINQKEILPDSREWLLKAITEDNTKRVSSKRRGDEPTHVQKRKHQITYLAHQAKANEQDLQNQWSNNRMSRRQTQSKYGF